VVLLSCSIFIGVQMKSRPTMVFLRRISVEKESKVLKRVVCFDEGTDGGWDLQKKSCPRSNERMRNSKAWISK
jgi:hypothetical protein